MEPEQQAELKAPESQEDLLSKKVGDLEIERLAAKNVVVKDISIQDQTKKDTGKVVGKIAHFMCKHPDKEELIDMSKVLYRKTEEGAVKESGLWYGEDKEKNIQKGSALAILMNYRNVTTLKELENQELETKANEAGFLCFKAYGPKTVETKQT